MFCNYKMIQTLSQIFIVFITQERLSDKLGKHSFPRVRVAPQIEKRSHPLD